MTSPDTSFHHPASRPMILMLLVPLLLGMGLAGPAGAQTAADTSRGGDHWPEHRSMHRMGAVDGPPSPTFMRDSIRVTSKELQQYSQRYQTHMAATKTLRDSVRTSLQSMRAAYEKGDRSEARSGRDTVRGQWKRLAEQDKKFADDLKNVLTKDQLTRFQQWRENRKREARQSWREHQADRRHGSPPDSTSASRTPADSGASPSR
jgi:Spy/CpxP family protein refolding chaperone